MTSNSSPSSSANFVSYILPFLPEIYITFTIPLFTVFYIWYYRHTQSRNPENNSINPFQQKVPYFFVGVILCTCLLLSVRTCVFDTLLTTVQKSVGSAIFESLILFYTIVVLYASYTYNKLATVNTFLFCILLLVNTLCIFLSIVAVHLLPLYLALESQQLCMIIFCTMRVRNSRGTESAIKYYILGSVTGSIFLFGIIFIYLGTGSLLITDIHIHMLQLASDNDPDLLTGTLFSRIGTVFIIVAFFFKLYAAPFHFWISDIYNGAPISITFYISVITYIVTIYVFLRFHWMLISGVTYGFDWLFTLIGALSTIIGTIGANSQTRIRRFLSYSSILHTGYLFMSLGTHIESVIRSCWMVCCWYTFTVSGLFIILLNIVGHAKTYPIRKFPLETLEDICQIRAYYPEISIQFVTVLFSLAGLPPFGGFVWKLIFLLELSNSSNWDMFFLVIIVSIFNMYIYLKIVKLFIYTKMTSKFGAGDLYFGIVMLVTFFALQNTILVFSIDIYWLHMNEIFNSIIFKS